jgi:hypothetical protein
MEKAFVKLALILLVLSTFVPIYASASIIRTDRTANIDKDETIAENVYLIGAEPKIQGNIEGDVFVAGNKIEFVGTLNGDFLSFGADLNLKGQINGDVRVIGGLVNVESDIEGDLVVIGSRVNILNNANVGGNLILIGGVVHLENTNQNHIRVISGNTIVSGKIYGTANVTSEKISILKNSEVKGEFSYFSPRQAFVEEGANVSGGVSFNKVDSIRENGLIKHAIVSFLNFWMLFRFITTLILTFILVYVFKIFSQKTAFTKYREFFGKVLAVGLLCFIFIPIAIVVLLASLILLPVAILIGMIYVGVFYNFNCDSKYCCRSFVEENIH